MMDQRRRALLFTLMLSMSLFGCGDDAEDDDGDTETSSGTSAELEDLALVPCPDRYHSSESGLASQTNCRLSDSCDAETKFVRLQIHADLDTLPAPGDYPVITYGNAEPGTTRAYYVPDASNEAEGEPASTGTVTVDSIEESGGALVSVTVTVDVPFQTARIAGTFTCPIEE